jgi:uncharacterized protein involved in exopolysaccharide biosynthesis
MTMNEQNIPAASAGEDEFSLLDILQVIADNLRLLVIVPLLAGLLALGIAFLITPTFTANTKFMPPQQQQSGASALLASLGGLGGLAGAAGGLKNPADQYLAFIKSRSVQDALIARFKLSERYESKYKEDARLALSGNVIATSGKDGLISIDVSDTDPKFAADLANGHVEELGRLLNRLALTEAQQRRVFFEKQLITAKDNLIKSEQILKASGVNSSALKTSPVAAVEFLAKLKASVTAQEIKLASMRGYLSESAPDFKQAQTEMAALRSQLNRAETEEPLLKDGDSNYIAKFRDYKYNETLFELFSKQYEIARIDESREGALIQVIDLAQIPEHKAKPKKSIWVLSTILITTMVLLIFIYIRQAFRNIQKSSSSSKKIASLKNSFYKSIGRKANFC